MKRLIFRLYNLLVLLALPFITVGVMIRWRSRFARGVERWTERWGRLSPAQAQRFQSGRWWWIHAVSLGEVKAIEVFLKDIPVKAGARVVLSLVTPEAISWAVENNLADEIIAAPVDLPWVVRRVFRAVRPELFCSVESEFWPNLLREARRSGARVALVNGRISAHSFRTYQKIRALLPALWENFDLVAVRQQEDAERFIDLGVRPSLIYVSGNLKYDLPLPEPKGLTSASTHRRLTLAIGSSREGEERELLPIIDKLRIRFSDLQIIWAPRHIERIGELESLLSASGRSLARKSVTNDTEVDHLLWDTMGDLIEAYKRSDVALVGGSFVMKGGQNPIEPASLGLPVVFGPSMENFKGISEVLVQHGGAKQVGLPDLEQCLAELLASEELRQMMGKRARATVESRQGASERTLKLLKELVHA